MFSTSTVIHQLIIHPKCNNCLYNFLQLFFFKKNYDNSSKINQNIFQKYEVYWVIFEWDTSKKLCIIGWEYITAQYDLAVAHPKVIHFAWNSVWRIIQYITMLLFFKKNVHVSSYMSVLLGGGVSLAGGWLYIQFF